MVYNVNFCCTKWFSCTYTYILKIIFSIIVYHTEYSSLLYSRTLFIHSICNSLHLLTLLMDIREETCHSQGGGWGLREGWSGRLALGRVFNLEGKGCPPSPSLEVGLRAEANGTAGVKVHSHLGCAVGFWKFQLLVELEAWSSGDIGKKLRAIFLSLVSSLITSLVSVW